MNEKNDELKFVTAHDESVSFKSFDDTIKNQDNYKDSNFSLIQQLSKKTDYISTTDLNGNAVEGLVSTTVKDLLSNQGNSGTETKTAKSLETVAKVNKTSSSIHDFLHIDSDLQRRNEKLNSYDFTSNDISIHEDHLQNEVHALNSSDFKTQNYVKNANRYEQLLDASTKGVYSNKIKSEDDLQTIYKRLLKCQ